MKKVLKAMMWRSVLLKSFFLIVPLFSVNVSEAQEPTNTVIKSDQKKQRIEDKKKAQKKREAEKAQKKLRKQHMAIQSKEVRKRMKRNEKKANRVNDNRREGVIERWRQAN